MPQYISAEGLEQLKLELEELKIKRQEIAHRLEEAKALGDLSENQEYIAAKEAQAFNEGKIIELEQLLRDVVVIENNKKHDSVQIGSTIEVRADGKNRIFTIVGSEEANPAMGRISNESPLGRAFLGKKLGDIIQVEIPSGKMSYKIASIK
jgi:transcription elongation factor GreA